MSDFEARNISRGPFTVAELEEVVAKGHGIVLDSADVPAILRAAKILEALEAEDAELVEDLDAGRRCMVKAVEKNQLLVAEMHAAAIKMTRKRRRVVRSILAAGDDPAA